jgi:acyl-CoA-binding protein
MVEYTTSPPPREFQAAVWFLKQPPVEGEPQATRATGNDVKLELYGLFKQATCGDTSTPRPSRFNVQQRFKWDAWDSRGHMSKEKAMAECVDPHPSALQMRREAWRTAAG